MLYIIGTPIGNLGEITNRAIETIEKCDYVACEDTRNTGKLFNLLKINKPLISYHKFNEKEKIQKIVEDLLANKNIGLVSDAGMPCVSDPGNILVNECIKNNIEYTVISGPSAFINAFILSGFSAPFTFIGFLPEKQSEIKKILDEYKNINSSLILYVSPIKVSKLIEQLFNILGERELCIVREISKIYETVEFTTTIKGFSGVCKGEFVVVVGPKITKENINIDEKTIRERYNFYLKKVDSSTALKEVAKELKLKKNDVYRVVKIK